MRNGKVPSKANFVINTIQGLWDVSFHHVLLMTLRLYYIGAPTQTAEINMRLKQMDNFRAMAVLDHWAFRRFMNILRPSFGEQLSPAHLWSRLRDRSDWKLHPTLFRRAAARWGWGMPTVDRIHSYSGCFAREGENSKLSSFSPAVA